MNFPDDAPVTPAKKNALRARIARLGIDVARVSMTPTKGSGAGGQKRNKTSSGVMLATEHLGRAYQTRCTESRGQALNRFLALRQLVDDIEEVVSPQTSERLAERERLRKQKDRRRRRAAGGGAAATGAATEAATEAASGAAGVEMPEGADADASDGDAGMPEDAVSPNDVATTAWSGSTRGVTPPRIPLAPGPAAERTPFRLRASTRRPKARS